MQACKFNSRTWHKWLGVVLALPMLIVAVTAIFLSHKASLQLNDIQVNAAWLPGYSAAAMQAARMDMRSGIVARSGTQYIGTKTGLYRIEDGRAVAVEALAGKEVRSLAETPHGLIAATRQGLWRETRDGWQQVLRGDAWQVSAAANGTLDAVFRKDGLKRSKDGGATWQAEPGAMQALASVPMLHQPEKITLSTLMFDLHTGEAFLGKDWEWIWIDLVGAVMAFLALTGIYMWWRGERRKLKIEHLKTSTQAATASAPSPQI